MCSKHINLGSTTFNIPNPISNRYFLRCSNTAGQIESDAIRNIYGQLFSEDANGGTAMKTVTGTFYNAGSYNCGIFGVSEMPENNGATDVYKIGFDAGRIVPVAGENRPINMSVIPIIRLY